jgi:tetratricopeptide (TPR) repeat protein
MKKIIAFIVLVYFFSACKNADTKTKQTADSLNNSSAQYLKTFEQKVQTFPDSAGLRLQYAFALDSLNKFQEALQQMDLLTNKDSGNYGLWFAKGNIAEDAQDTLLAIKSNATAAHIYESPDALLALANLYAEQKNNRAITLCSRVKALGLGRESDANCAFIIGVYYARTHDMNNALKYFDECIAYSYTYMEAYIEKGLLYFDAKQYDRALEIFQMASTVNNLYADAYYYQARCYEMMNKKDSAVLNFKQAIQIDPRMKEAREQLKQLGDE